MSRPTTHDDLPDYVRQGHTVATIPATFITRFPSLGQHLLAALSEAERLGLPVVEDSIVIPKTDDELDTALRQAQTSWDYNSKTYAQVADGEPLEEWRQYTVKNHARTEGLPVPEFDEDGHATFPADVEAVA